MNVLVLGAAGMIGRKIAERLAAEGRIAGRPVQVLTLIDVVRPRAPAGSAFPVRAKAVDLAAPGIAESLIGERPDIILHLAAVVSGEAEVDFVKGYRVNLAGMQAMLEAIRALPDYRPRLVFASSLAVFGPPFPARIPDDFAPRPATSYGTQKLMCELLVTDYSRKGYVDGVSLRLPTICIRPGAPNRAASGFFSGILREPLAGLPAILPVPETTRHYFASPRAAAGFFLHAAGMNTTPLGQRRALIMPGLSATVADEIEALGRVAGSEAVSLIRREPDPLVAEIVAGWAADYEAAHARELGFSAETDMDAIIRVHLEDEAGAPP